MARNHLLAGELDAAEELLKPMLLKRRLHVMELAALCSAQIDLYMARGDSEAARGWLDMWAKADPDNPEIAALPAGNQHGR